MAENKTPLLVQLQKKINGEQNIMHPETSSSQIWMDPDCTESLADIVQVTDASGVVIQKVIKGVTPEATSNSTEIATTAFVKNAITASQSSYELVLSDTGILSCKKNGEDSGFAMDSSGILSLV